MSDPADVPEGLKYIADSPPREHGGFPPQAVRAAKDGLSEIAALRRELAEATRRYGTLEQTHHSVLEHTGELLADLAAKDAEIEGLNELRDKARQTLRGNTGTLILLERGDEPEDCEIPEQIEENRAVIRMLTPDREAIKPGGKERPSGS